MIEQIAVLPQKVLEKDHNIIIIKTKKILSKSRKTYFLSFKRL